VGEVLGEPAAARGPSARARPSVSFFSASPCVCGVLQVVSSFSFLFLPVLSASARASRSGPT